MVDVAFYHLQTVSLDAALPQLLAKCRARDWRVVVEVGAPARVQELDDHLWTFSDESFLPHGAEGSLVPAQGGSGVETGSPADQPIWLCCGQDNPNGAQVRFFVEGAMPASSGALETYTRAIVMIDGDDEVAVQRARTAWKDLRAAGLALSYWRQSQSGAWQRADQ